MNIMNDNFSKMVVFRKYAALLFAFAMISCNNSDDVDITPPGIITQRVVNSKTYSKNKLVQEIIYDYDGDNLVLQTVFKDVPGVGMTESIRIAFSYNGPIVTMEMRQREVDFWTKVVTHVEYTLSNGRLAKVANFDVDSGNLKSFTEYTYSGGYLASSQTYLPDRADQGPSYKSEYKKEGDDLYELMTYENVNGQFVESNKVAFHYNNDKIAEVIRYDGIDTTTGEWIKKAKFDYQYAGVQVGAYDDYVWNSQTNNWDYLSTDSFSFDNYDYLTEHVYTDTYNGNIRHVYSYERGKGNAALLGPSPTIHLYKRPFYE